ncbi:helix-turn-helix domain-containing protein [Streptomyces sp. NPDC050738]|uniref:helix-turn-helix domain-containing protein n=1 Tax=Streptomyces sp. NPDC050738 TaxID=3154744 RepID=UPI003431A32B
MGLEDLGLSADEDAVYRTLIQVPAADGAEVAEAATLSAVRAQLALGSLVDRGLVTARGQDGGRRYVAAPPAVALGVELAAHRERLQRAELTVARLVETYRTASVDRSQRELVEIVEGTEAIRTRYLQIQLSARHTVDIFSAGEPRAVTPTDSEEVTSLARDVRVRAVVDQGFLKEPGAAEHVGQSLADGVQVRTVVRVPCKLILADGDTAMLPLHGDSGDVDPAVVLRGGAAHLARELFEQVWERGRPYQEPAAELDALDTDVLRLLLAGFTDTAVAGLLEMSVRTLQRRIQMLMAKADATTRLQLGWYARDRGWV